MADETELVKVRNLLYRASADKDDSKTFYDYLRSSPNLNSSMLSGYQGMAYMIRANYSWNPYNKLSFFFKGRDLLDGAIEKDPTNIELRWLRFCVQTNAPSFLAYSGKTKEDKAIVLYGYSLLKDGDLKERIKKYMNDPKYCTAQERNLL
ncbi:MAG: hypothetical protein KBG47_13255 [Bacteroidia bacterium]|nr:hypothetical protein [Bacteroidia bacterium]